MSAPTDRSHSDQAPRIGAPDAALWTGKWAPARRIAVFLAGCLQQFIHTIFFRKRLLPHYEWWDLVEPGMYYLTEGMALATSLGLLVAPFLTRPGRAMRTLLMTSFALGVVGNAARIAWGLYMGELWAPLFCDPAELGISCGNWLGRFITLFVFYLIFGALIYLNLKLFLRLRGSARRHPAR